MRRRGRRDGRSTFRQVDAAPRGDSVPPGDRAAPGGCGDRRRWRERCRRPEEAEEAQEAERRQRRWVWRPRVGLHPGLRRRRVWRRWVRWNLRRVRFRPALRRRRMRCDVHPGLPGQELRREWLRRFLRELRERDDVPGRALRLRSELLGQELRQQRMWRDAADRAPETPCARTAPVSACRVATGRQCGAQWLRRLVRELPHGLERRARAVRASARRTATEGRAAATAVAGRAAPAGAAEPVRVGNASPTRRHRIAPRPWRSRC